MTNTAALFLVCVVLLFDFATLFHFGEQLIHTFDVTEVFFCSINSHQNKTFGGPVYWMPISLDVLDSGPHLPLKFFVTMLEQVQQEELVILLDSRPRGSVGHDSAGVLEDRLVITELQLA